MSQDLLRVVVVAEPREGHRVFLRFDDGAEVEVDLRPVIGEFVGVFAPLADPAYLARLRVDPAAGTVVWPNGADLDPVVLYCALRGKPLPQFRERKPRRSSKGERRSRRTAPRETGGRGRKAGA